MNRIWYFLISTVVVLVAAFFFHEQRLSQKAMADREARLKRERLYIEQIKSSGRVELAVEEFVYVDTVKKVEPYTVFGFSLYDATTSRVFYVPGRCSFMVDFGDGEKTQIYSQGDSIIIAADLIMDHLYFDIEGVSINSLEESWLSQMDDVNTLRDLSKRIRKEYAPQLAKAFLWNPVLDGLEQGVFEPLSDKVIILELNSGFWIGEQYYEPSPSRFRLR
ncbi:hypothetical protein [Persicobacter sp. CCB-QB2]|uniref:hypothetical protein n=1 Tax=Persicobacter sp. CCB-QB2 TaxID=1561025 RepID=UPI0006A9F9D8|nr:hypothetical protein [Persicobacter sp. CCB-QB2]